MSLCKAHICMIYKRYIHIIYILMYAYVYIYILICIHIYIYIYIIYVITYLSPFLRLVVVLISVLRPCVERTKEKKVRRRTRKRRRRGKRGENLRSKYAGVGQSGSDTAECRREKSDRRGKMFNASIRLIRSALSAFKNCIHHITYVIIPSERSCIKCRT